MKNGKVSIWLLFIPFFHICVFAQSTTKPQFGDGITVRGGGGSNEVFTLPSNKRIKIPTSYLRRFNGQLIEWNGVPPDIVVPQTGEDIRRGQDKQLERAIAMLK